MDVDETIEALRVADCAVTLRRPGHRPDFECREQSRDRRRIAIESDGGAAINVGRAVGGLRPGRLVVDYVDCDRTRALALERVNAQRRDVVVDIDRQKRVRLVAVAVGRRISESYLEIVLELGLRASLVRVIGKRYGPEAPLGRRYSRRTCRPSA